MSQSKNLLPTSDIQKRFSVTSRTVHRWQNHPSYDFPKPVKIGRMKYWLESDIDSFVAAHRQRA